MIKVLAIGDVVGKPGRSCLRELLPKIKEEHNPDFVIVNGENAAGGFGITRKIFSEFVDKYGISCVTTGNHWHDKPEIRTLVGNENRLLLPANMHNVGDERHGLAVLQGNGKRRIAVINLHGKAFMYGDNRCPFDAVDRLLKLIPDDVKTRIVDVHAEASSEKQALGHYLEGRVSLVYGTHTHCPTADTRILNKKTGFQTDLGMTGPYDSVIGIKKEASLARFLNTEKKAFEPAKKDPRLYAVLASIDAESGHCKHLERLEYLNKQTN